MPALTDAEADRCIDVGDSDEHLAMGRDETADERPPRRIGVRRPALATT